MGKGGGKSAARGGGGSGGKYDVKDSMTPQQVDALHTRLANDAADARLERDRQMEELSKSVSNGSIPISQLSNKMDAINTEYEKKMSAIRMANNKLASKYGVFQQL